MKKLVVLALALVLVACAAPPAPTDLPTEPVLQPTQTPFVVVETVVVTVIPTDVPTDVPTTVPTATALPPPTEVPATQPPAATAAPVEAADSGLVNVDNTLGAGWFTNMTLTGNSLSLRCQANKQITFSVQPNDPGITQVDFYYRIQDRATGAMFDWQGPKRMFLGANGNFMLDFTGEDVSANFRKPNAWFDFQFVGLSRTGGRIGNSEKIVQQVSYTFDCP